MSTTLDAAANTNSEEHSSSSTTAVDEHSSRRHHREKAKRPKRTSKTVRLLLIGIALWAFLGFAIVHLGHNDIMRGTWMLLGAALVPSALVWTMSHRLVATDTLTPAALVRAMILGGLGAVVIGGTFDTIVGIWSPPIDGGPGLLSLLTSGVVEEAAKAAFVIILGWNLAKTVRNGLFLGGAVGAGFAAYETLGYILNSMFDAGSIVADPTIEQAQTAFGRSLFMPLMHPIWAALLGAAIFAAARNEKFRLTLGVVGAYLGVAVLHGLWDGGAYVVTDLTTNTLLREVFAAPQHVVIIVVEVLIWRHVVRKYGAAKQQELPVTS